MPRSSAVHAVTTLGIDMGKNTLHMIGLDTRGGIVLREKVSRGRITSRLANLPPCLIGIEAGMATHYVARELAALRHDVKQVPPTYAKPFRQGHKNDFRDANWSLGSCATNSAILNGPPSSRSCRTNRAAFGV
jgi:transposase